MTAFLPCLTGDNTVESANRGDDTGKDFTSSALENNMGASNNDGIYITDNIFYGSAANLLCLTDNLWNDTGKVNQPMVFSGNVYAQSAGGILCNFNWEQGWCAGYASDEREFLDFIGDATGKIVSIPQ